MMISPESYVSMYENAPFPKLIKERDKLVREIRRLEKLVFSDDRMSEEWMICPMPDVQYQVNLRYLSALSAYMSERYNREFEGIDDDEDEEVSEITETQSSIRIQKIGITKLNVDAVVNAANDCLLEGGGVCGAIFREAGSAELTEACQAIGGCRTGSAVITPGFRLPAKYIIHAVGPVWQGGNQNEPKLLYSAYKHSLKLAKENGCHSIGFPLLSAGIFGYPKPQAWRKAIQACRDFIRENPDYPMEITFAVLEDAILELGMKTLEELPE